MYKRAQLERRLASFLQREGFSNAHAFIVALRQEPSLYRRFHTYLTIHVTDFFRDLPYWMHLKQIIAHHPQKQWSLWSAGCSWGAEPVTAALIFEDLALPYHIKATDSDDIVLEQARQGVYAEDSYQKVPSNYRRFFRLHNDQWRLKPLTHGTISYLRHDLVHQPPPGTFDAVICRNLIIYFEPPARSRALANLQLALRPGGLLFLGATETFLEYHELGFSPLAPSIYQKD
ncbi:MAG: chemotaxis protein CheR [Sulfobacillus acidophilus]|uniref:Chemotaxis protein CheR n=1 Tax=Sulfobacillus acidophilus TaxID=53633 RepID=A0A2T2WKQ9_9FIRM|nr:MAG: chemotaxis protein CheR [Sulfobacillus acidophilus]